MKSKLSRIKWGRTGQASMNCGIANHQVVWMRENVKWQQLAIACCLLLIFSALLDGYDAFSEYQLIKTKAFEITSDSESPHKAVEAIAVKIRSHVVPGDRNVPFLRSTALDTWLSGEGHCGDAARVMVLMLQSIGIRAHRIYLRNDPKDYFHIAVAYEIEKRSYLIDTVDSTQEFAAFAKKNAGSSLDEIGIPNSQFYSYSYVNWGRVPPFIQVDQTRSLPRFAVLMMESPFFLLGVLKGGVGFLRE